MATLTSTLMEQTENQAGKERMQMWRDGIFKDSGQYPQGHKGSGIRGQQRSGVRGQGPVTPATGHWYYGFTLIELLVTLSILSITLSFVIPRLMGREEAELKSTARKLLYTVRRLSDEAVFKKERQAINVYINNNEYKKRDDGKRLKLPPGTSVDHLQIGKEVIKKGTASITIFPSNLEMGY